jgi:hypothetical protein
MGKMTRMGIEFNYSDLPRIARHPRDPRTSLVEQSVRNNELRMNTMVRIATNARACVSSRPLHRLPIRVIRAHP